jgi:ABC-2 type transport system ATP-binding protein
MLEVRNLTKRFGSLTAVDNLSFTAEPGRVTGFLGPNGAGKTTTLRMALGLIKANSGEVRFDGKMYKQIAKPATHVGASLEATSFDPGRSAINHLKMLAAYSGIPTSRCTEMLRLVGLGDVAKKKVGAFSMGMRARLNLAAAMLGDPNVLIFDEPTNGLDPEGIAWIRDLLRHFASEGRTVLISSHMLAEVQQTVDDVVIIAHGKLVHQSSLSELRAMALASTYVEPSDPEAFSRLAADNGWTLKPERRGYLVSGAEASQIGQASFAAGIWLSQLATHSAGLEDTFFALTEGQGTPR